MSTAYSESFKIMEKAEEAIEVAEYNINGGFNLAATNRAYFIKVLAERKHARLLQFKLITKDSL